MFPRSDRINTEITSLKYIYEKCKNKGTSATPNYEEIANACGYTKHAYYSIPSIIYTVDMLKTNSLYFDNEGFNGYYLDNDYIRLPVGLPDEIYKEIFNVSAEENMPILFKLHARDSVKRKMLEIVDIIINGTKYKTFMLLDRTGGVLISTYWVSEVRMDSENVLCKVECHRFKAMVEFLKKCHENGWKVGAIDENSRFYK